MVKSKGEREREFWGEVLGQVWRDLFMKENPINNFDIGKVEDCVIERCTWGLGVNNCDLLVKLINDPLWKREVVNFVWQICCCFFFAKIIS